MLIIVLTYICIGIFLNMIWHFPYFYGFTSIFCFVAFLSVKSIITFERAMRKIVAEIAIQPPSRKANAIYIRCFKKSTMYIIVPLLVVFTFGTGGCFMFGAIKCTLTLIWMLILFFCVVYVSIIGYIEYISLAIYIRNLSNAEGNYKQLEKIDNIGLFPANIEWMKELVDLLHIYRNSFFSLGSAYIVAYAAFCWLPETHANTHSFSFYLLWTIIFLVIVIMFPLVSLLENKYIKTIVRKLKNSYIYDIKKEHNIYEISSKKAKQHFNLIVQIYINQILLIKDYPFQSKWSYFYAAISSTFNFVAALLTIIQGTPFLTNVLMQSL